MFSFWGSVFGAIVAGFITILTTHWIIKRSYQVDYHNERMNVLPVLGIEIPNRHFSNELDSKAEFISEIEELYSVCKHEFFNDMMLLKFENTGPGIAFKIKVSGMWGDEYFSLSELKVGGYKYIITQDCENFKVVVHYYDIYGNFYVQTFKSEVSHKLYANENPPELAMRTKRIRYCQ